MKPEKNNNYLRQSFSNNDKVNVNRIFSLIEKQESFLIEDQKNNFSKFSGNRQDSLNIQKPDPEKNNFFNLTEHSRFLTKGVSRSTDPDKKRHRQRSKIFERELEDRRIQGLLQGGQKPVKVLENDLIFLEIKSEVLSDKKSTKRGFHGVLCANGVVGQGLFSLEKGRTEELQPGKYLFQVILKTNLTLRKAPDKASENMPVIFGERLYLKHVFSQKFLKIELENLANQKGHVRAILTESPSELKIIPSTWTKLQGQNMFYGEGVLVCPGDSEKLFLSIEAQSDSQGRYPVNGSDVFCEWIPFLFTSEDYSKSLSSNSLLNGSFGRPDQFDCTRPTSTCACRCLPATSATCSPRQTSSAIPTSSTPTRTSSGSRRPFGCSPRSPVCPAR